MKVFIVLALATLAYANVIPSVVEGNTAYGYIKNYAIPLAEEIRKSEEQMSQSRIVGGIPSNVGQFPYQAGLLASYQSISGTGVCGGVLVSSNRVLTAAHCWFDGINQAWMFTVVLGSTTIFTGGTRFHSNTIAIHPNWFPLLARNDVAVIYLPISVAFSANIGPIALPTGTALQEDFAGFSAVASGFGLTSNSGSISANQGLSHVTLNVISNTVCSVTYPIIENTNICTSGVGGASTCRGDSGGPLVITRNGNPLLIGLTSFGHPTGCEAGFPAVYARVTSYMDFFNQHI